MSYLRFPPGRGQVWTGYPCCHPEHRGRGIARAVKLQSLAQAVALGVPYVYTDNDSENAPMLHLNERLGYGRRPGLIALLKWGEKEPHCEYAGLLRRAPPSARGCPTGQQGRHPQYL